MSAHLPSRHVPQTVMVIDDEPFMIELLGDVLRDLGVGTVLSAQDGRDALSTLARQPRQPELMICDLCMPEMDGIAFLRNVCLQGYRGDIILFSGLDISVLKAAEQLAVSYSAALLGVLGKPLDRAALAELIGRHAERRPAPGTAGPPPLEADEIRAAIAGSGLITYFQPKLSVPDGRVVGAECLARIRHPVRGIVGPGLFIPAAEQCGLIDDLTLAVFGRAVEQARVWQERGAAIDVAVNVSMESLGRLELPDVLASIAQRAGVSSSAIILEVTETKLPQDFVASLDVLTRLRIKGFNLSIDDFGTGYSSLESLKNLPFNELKIDRAFVSGGHRDASSRAIVDSSVRLGRELRLKLVAEGVETQEEWDFVARAGCQQVQGFFAAGPMPPAEFDAWRARWEGGHRRG